MTVTIIGKINPDNKQICFYSQAANRPAQVDDIVLSNDRFHRMVWNHNGQRLTSVDISQLVYLAWLKSEAQ